MRASPDLLVTDSHFSNTTSYSMHQRFNFCLILAACLTCCANADDWPRFRGHKGSGVAQNSVSIPSKWSPTHNIVWKVSLPGPGASSPIIVDEKVFVTCYSGYGVTRERQGELKDLVRHLICIDLKTGQLIWKRDIPAWLPEDSYYDSGVSSHGYASHTPVSDGTNVYCFFGKGGVHAFDLDGQKLWQADAGTESDPPKWGSSSSPVVYKDTLIVTASAESQSIIGFDKTTGKIKWRQTATGLDGMWGTPTLLKIEDSRTDLVMLVPKEIWGLDPLSGQLRWYEKATKSSQAYTSVILQENRVFAFSGEGGGSLALDVSGDGETSQTDLVWQSPVKAIYSSPVQHHSKLYLVSRGVLFVVDAETGERLKQIRLRGAKKTPAHLAHSTTPRRLLWGIVSST